MGQKVHPIGIRLGYIADWSSKWFSTRNFATLLEEDQTIRKYLRNKLRMAAVSKVGLERAGKYLRVNIYTARPGIVIGKKGQDIENIIRDIEEISNLKGSVNVSVLEIQRPELDAQLVAAGIALQLERNIGYRRAMKKSIERTMQGGAQGVKIMIGGRLGGNEIARQEWMKEGRVPLQTFRAEIDYGFMESNTKMGKIGVKVWIFKKEHYKKTEREIMDEAARLIEKEKLNDPAKVPEPAKDAAGIPADAVEDASKTGLPVTDVKDPVNG